MAGPELVHKPEDPLAEVRPLLHDAERDPPDRPIAEPPEILTEKSDLICRRPPILGFGEERLHRVAVTGRRIFGGAGRGAREASRHGCRHPASPNTPPRSDVEIRRLASAHPPRSAHRTQPPKKRRNTGPQPAQRQRSKVRGARPSRAAASVVVRKRAQSGMRAMSDSPAKRGVVPRSS